MAEARTEDNKFLKTFLMKDPDYVMQIMASCMALDELEGVRTRRDFIDSSGTKDTKKFIYGQKFGLHFIYIHQVDDHNNGRHAPISLARTWVTKSCLDHNLTWYLSVSEVNTALAPGHFQIDGVVQPGMDFW